MTRKLNKDNGLQDWKTKHQSVKVGIFYCQDRAGFSVSASNKLLCNLTMKMFWNSAIENYMQTVSGIEKGLDRI